jgi:hypothetical protein
MTPPLLTIQSGRPPLFLLTEPRRHKPMGKSLPAPHSNLFSKTIEARSYPIDS